MNQECRVVASEFTGIVSALFGILHSSNGAKPPLLLLGQTSAPILQIRLWQLSQPRQQFKGS